MLNDFASLNVQKCASKDTCSKLAFLKRGWSFTGIATTCNDVRLTPLILMQLFQIRHYMYFPHFPWFCPSFLFENCYFELQYFLYIPLRFRNRGFNFIFPVSHCWPNKLLSRSEHFIYYQLSNL